MRHFTVVTSFVVKFGASWRGFTVIDCRSNSGGGERASAKYSLGFKIVVVKANDVADTTGYCARDGRLRFDDDCMRLNWGSELMMIRIRFA